jgi:hypothetical protein
MIMHGVFGLGIGSLFAFWSLPSLLLHRPNLAVQLVVAASFTGVFSMLGFGVGFLASWFLDVGAAEKRQPDEGPS